MPDEVFNRYLAESRTLLAARKCPLCEHALDGDVCPDCYDGAEDSGYLSTLTWPIGHDLSHQLDAASEHRAEAAHGRGEL
jgi:hypothetical protein